MKVTKVLDWISIALIAFAALGVHRTVLGHLHYYITGTGTTDFVIPAIIFIALSLCAIFFILSQHGYKKIATGFNILLLVLALPLLLSTIPDWLTTSPTAAQNILFSLHRFWLLVFAAAALILSTRKKVLWDKVLAVVLYLYIGATMLFGLLFLSSNADAPILGVVVLTVALLLNPIYLLSQTQRMQRVQKRKMVCYILLTASLLLVTAFRMEAEILRGRDFWLVVAQNPDTPKYVLRKLAYYENSDKRKQSRIRSGVAGNPSTPPGILETFVHQDAQVRSRLATNRNTPVYILKQLAEDEDLDVRYRIASNPSTPTHILRAYMQGNYDEYLDGSDKEVRITLHGIARNPNAPEDILSILAEHENSEIRINLARNPATPPHILEKLAKSAKRDEDYLRHELYHNPNTPPHTPGIRPRVIPE